MPFDIKKEISDYLRLNGILEFDKKKQLIETVKLISRIPWGEGRTVEEVLKTQKVGTCQGKHLVLQACFDELGIKYRPVVCTFYWLDQPIKFPDNIKAILREGAWGHGHNFIQVMINSSTHIDVDVTFNPELKPYGFLTFPQDWDGQTSFIAVNNIIQRWDGIDMLAKKRELIESLNSETRDRRARFLKEFIKWVDSLNK